MKIYTELVANQAGFRVQIIQSARNVINKETQIPQQILWEIWTRLKDWPTWSKPLHVSTRWLGTAGWQVGAEFEQVLQLGFPLGTTTSQEKIGAVVPVESVMWWKEEKGIKSCHIWRFEALPEGQTRISNVEVFHGIAMGVVKPLLAKRWQRLFEASVAGLIQQAQQNQ